MGNSFSKGNGFSSYTGGKSNEKHKFMYYLGNGRGQLSINADPERIQSVRGLLYLQNYVDVARAGVDQKVDREVLGSVLEYVEDELKDPNPRYYTDGYYKGSNRPEDIVREHERLMSICKNKSPNSYVSVKELHNKEAKDIDDEIDKSYKAFGM